MGPERFAKLSFDYQRASAAYPPSVGVLCSNTMEVFQELVARGEVSSSEAFAILNDTADSPHDRTLLTLPLRHQDLRV